MKHNLCNSFMMVSGVKCWIQWSENDLGLSSYFSPGYSFFQHYILLWKLILFASSLGEVIAKHTSCFNLGLGTQPLSAPEAV